MGSSYKERGRRTSNDRPPREAPRANQKHALEPGPVLPGATQWWLEMVRGSGGQNRVFNLASDTWHAGVVSKAGCFREKRKHHEKVLHSETLYLLEEKKTHKCLSR